MNVHTLSFLSHTLTAIPDLGPAAVSAFAMSSGRLAASTAAVLGLFGLVVGCRALVRPADRLGTDSGRRGALVALLAGAFGAVVGGWVIATAQGGVGTGNGLGGAVVAVVVGLVAGIIGGLALARSGRPAERTTPADAEIRRDRAARTSSQES